MGKCSFCRKENVLVSSNTFYGPYCSDCIKLVIYESKKCLAEIKQQKEAQP